jgi:hypothetical protein
MKNTPGEDNLIRASVLGIQHLEFEDGGLISLE